MDNGNLLQSFLPVSQRDISSICRDGKWCGAFFFNKKSFLKAGNKCFVTSQVERLSLSTFANRHRHKMAWNRSI